MENEEKKGSKLSQEDNNDGNIILTGGEERKCKLLSQFSLYRMTKKGECGWDGGGGAGRRRVITCPRFSYLRKCKSSSSL